VDAALLAQADALDGEAAGLAETEPRRAELRTRAAELRVKALGATRYPVLVCPACFCLTGWLDDDGVCATDAARRGVGATSGFYDVRDSRPRFEEPQAPLVSRIGRALGLGTLREREREWLTRVEPGQTGPTRPEEGWELEWPISFERQAPSGPHLLVHFDTQSIRFGQGAWREADSTRGGKPARLGPREFSASLATEALAEAWADFKEEVAAHNRAVWTAEAAAREERAAAEEERRLAAETERGTSGLLG